MTAALAETLRAHGGPLAILADGVATRRPQEPWAPRIAAGGPRAAGREAEYELLLEMILEGSRLHYATVPPPADDQDLALLLGDQLYALGLVRLATLADLEAVAELADVISLVAQAHAAADGELAEAAWRAGAAAIGWGSTKEHEAAKDLARAGAPGAAAALRAASVRGS